MGHNFNIISIFSGFHWFSLVVVVSSSLRFNLVQSNNWTQSQFAALMGVPHWSPNCPMIVAGWSWVELFEAPRAKIAIWLKLVESGWNQLHESKINLKADVLPRSTITLLSPFEWIRSFKFKVNFLRQIWRRKQSRKSHPKKGPEFDQFWRRRNYTSFLESKVSEDCAAS